VNGGPVNRLLTFMVDIKVDNQIPKQCKKTDLKVCIEGPSTISNVNIMGGDRANFKVSFTPTVAGSHWADFVFKGTWANHPHKFPISDGPNCPEHEYTGKYRSGNAPLPLTSSASVASIHSNEDEEKKKREDEERQKEEEHKKEQQRKDLDERKRREEDRKRKEEEEREERIRREEEERIRKEEEERIRKEEEMRLEAERLRKEQSRRVKAQKLEKIENLTNQLSALSNEELASEINKTLERLQILFNIQQKRIEPQ
jgi:hypothetical protein